MARNCVNVLTVINSASNITNETIDGKDYIVVHNVTPIVDDIVMNRKLYPSAEIKKSFNSLERTPMPLGHPKKDGKNISALDPFAVNEYWVGAWLQNVQHDNGKVSGDMYVDRQVAERSEKGKRLVNRLDDMAAQKNVEPIHISTGLLYQGIAANGESRGKRYNEIATNMRFDHTAILLDEPGAGTPAEGVGIFVNSDGTESEIEIAHLSDAADCTREGILNKARFFFTNASKFSFDDINRAISDKLNESCPLNYLWPETVWPDEFIYRNDSRYFKQKYLIDDDGKAVFVGEPVEVVRKPTEYEVVTNTEHSPMKELIINALKEKGKPTDGKTPAELMDAYNQMIKEETEDKNKDKEKEKEKDKTTTTNSEEVPAWAKSLVDKVDSLGAQFAANSDAERKTMREAVKKHFNISDIAVNTLDGEALKEWYAQCHTADSLHSGFHFQPNSEQDQWKGYDMNANFEEQK